MFRSWHSRLVAGGLALCTAFTLWQALRLPSDSRASGLLVAGVSAAVGFCLLRAVGSAWPGLGRRKPEPGEEEDDTAAGLAMLAVLLGAAAAAGLQALPPRAQVAGLGLAVGVVAAWLAAALASERKAS